MEEGVIGGTDGFIVAFVTSNTERDKDAFLSAVKKRKSYKIIKEKKRKKERKKRKDKKRRQTLIINLSSSLLHNRSVKTSYKI